MLSKRGFQLSLNMIIMVILALVFLGVAIWFIREMVPEVPSAPDMCEVYPPTAGNPVCAPGEITLERAKTKTVAVAFYNDEDADIGVDQKPYLSCAAGPGGQEPDIQVSVAGAVLPVGKTADYNLVISTPGDAARESYSCRLILSQTQEAITVTVS